MLDDLRFAIRLTRKTPILSLTATASLTIAFALATAGFTAVKTAFFGTLPGPYGNRIVAINDFNRTGGWTVPFDLTEFERRQKQVTTFDSVGAFHVRSVSAGDDGQFGVVRVAYVTPNTFDILGVSPQRGRHLQPADAKPGAPAVVVLGEGLAGRTFGTTDPIGKTIRVDGTVREIVGVIGNGCRFPDRAAAWLPIGAEGTSPAVSMFGRLRPGVAEGRAAAEMDVIAAQNPLRMKDVELIAIVEPFARSNAAPDERRVAIAAVAGLSVLVLVFAANVANLLLVRTASRRRELAVREALGASRRRLIGQVALEALALALIAAAAGSIAASQSLAWVANRFGNPPYWMDLSLQPTIIMFVLILALAATLIAGVVPALKVLSSSTRNGLREGMSRLRFGRVSGAVVVVELTLAVAMLGGAAVIGRGLIAFSYGRYHLPGDQVVVSQIYFGQPPALTGTASATMTREQRLAIWRAFERRADDAQRALIRRLEATPGVQVSRSMHYPGNDTPNARVDIDTVTGALSAPSRVVEIDDRFLSVLGSAAVSGRNLTATDIQNGAPVALVNLPFARKYFGEGSALGRRVRQAGSDEWREVVGVVPDLALNPGAPSGADGIYVPLSPTTIVRLGIRTPAAERAERDLHQAALGLELKPQIQWTTTLGEQMATAESIFRTFAGLLFIAGGGALLLACAGIYAIVAFDVTQRRKEIAIRIAVGASPRDIVRAILGRTLVQLALGVTAGAGLAAVVSHLIGTLPITVEANDPSFAAVVALLLLATALGACARPLASALGTRPADWLRDL